MWHALLLSTRTSKHTVQRCPLVLLYATTTNSSRHILVHDKITEVGLLCVSLIGIINGAWQQDGRHLTIDPFTAEIRRHNRVVFVCMLWAIAVPGSNISKETL